MENNEQLFDYIIVDSYNNWLSFGKQETEKQIQSNLADVLASVAVGTEVKVFKATELIEESVRKQ